MILTDNKKDIIYDKVYFAKYYKERNVRKSNWDIYLKQDIWLSSRISSNNLIFSIYNEISR